MIILQAVDLLQRLAHWVFNWNTSLLIASNRFIGVKNVDWTRQLLLTIFCYPNRWSKHVVVPLYSIILLRWSCRLFVIQPRSFLDWVWTAWRWGSSAGFAIKTCLRLVFKHDISRRDNLVLLKLLLLIIRIVLLARGQTELLLYGMVHYLGGLSHHLSLFERRTTECFLYRLVWSI